MRAQEPRHGLDLAADSKNSVEGVLVLDQAAADRFVHDVTAGHFNG